MTQPLFSPDVAGPLLDPMAPVTSPQAPGGAAGHGQDLQAAEAEFQARRKQQQEHQAALEAKYGKVGVALTKVGQGALDAVTAPGALAAAALEGIGSFSGAQGLERFGRELGDSASGEQALAVIQSGAAGAALRDVFGGISDRGQALERYEKYQNGLREQEQAYPMLSAVSRAAGAVAASVATGSGAVGLTRMGATAGVAAEGAAAGAQSGYAEDAPITDIIGSTILGATLGGGLTYGAQQVPKLLKRIISKERANEYAVRALGATGAETNKLSEKLRQQIGDDLLNLKLPDGKAVLHKGLSAQELASRVDDATDMVGQNLGAVKAEISAANEPAIESAKRWLSAVDGQIKELRTFGPSVARRADQVLDETQYLRGLVNAHEDATRKLLDSTSEIRGFVDRSLASKSASTRTFAEKLGAQLDTAEDLIASGAFDRSEVRKSLGELTQFFQSHPSSGIRARAKELRGELSKIFRSSKSVGFDDMQKQIENLKEFYPKTPPGGGLRMAPDAASEVLAAERALAGEIDTYAEGVLSRIAPERSGDFRKWRDLYHTMKKSDILSDRAVGHQAGQNVLGLQDVLSGTAVAAGQFAQGDMTAPIKGLMTAWLSKQIRARGNSFMASLYSRLASDTIAAPVKGLVPVLKRSAATVPALGVPTFLREARSPLQLQHVYNQRLETLVAQRPDDFDPGPMGAALTPEMSGMIGAAMEQKLSQLLTDMPKPKPSMRGKSQETLSIDDLRKANAMYEATLDPLSVFDDFKTGNVDYDKVKYAWKQWPGLKQLAQAAISDVLDVQLGDKTKEQIPESLWTQLDYLFGFNGQLQGTIDPGFSARMDQVGVQGRAQEAAERRQMQLPTAKKTFPSRLMSAQ